MLSKFFPTVFVDSLESIGPIHSNVGVIATFGCITAVQVRFKGCPAKLVVLPLVTIEETKKYFIIMFYVCLKINEIIRTCYFTYNSTLVPLIRYMQTITP